MNVIRTMHMIPSVTKYQSIGFGLLVYSLLLTNWLKCKEMFTAPRA